MPITQREGAFSVDVGGGGGNEAKMEGQEMNNVAWGSGYRDDTRRNQTAGAGGVSEQEHEYTEAGQTANLF